LPLAHPLRNPRVDLGTYAMQRRTLGNALPKTRLLVIADCGHSSHRDQPELLSREAGRFIVGPADHS
jgi:pimeloyl-ACP methyl ester carboxylesterase